MVERQRRAVTERRVTVRPAPDLMGYVTGLLPMGQAVAVHATLTRDADALKAAGDDRSLGQLMADLLHDRVTGLSAASGTPVMVNLTMTDRALLASGREPAHLEGYGTIPAASARDLVHAALTTKLADPETGELCSQTAVWVTRVFTHPTTGQLLAMDFRSRTAPAGLADLVDIRDGGICRTPWCNAPIRHHDHPEDWATGGETSETNQQGLCAGCNYAKQAPGWTADGAHPHPGRTRPGPTPGHHHHTHRPHLHQPRPSPTRHPPRPLSHRTPPHRLHPHRLNRPTRPIPGPLSPG